MNNTIIEDKLFSRRTIDVAIKLTALAVVFSICYDIIKPFILPIVWAAILAVSLYPIFLKLTRLLGNKKSLAATIIALIGIAILVIPTVKFSSSAIESVQHLSEGLKNGTLTVPEPNESVKEWPVIGAKVYPVWLDASNNLESFLTTYSTQIKNASSKLFGAVAGFGGTVVQFIISIIIAAVFMNKADACSQGCSRFLKRLLDERGERALNTSVATIRSVATGILGIALTQALLSGVGLFIADIPAVGIWVLAVLILAIVQLPPIIILGPISAYYFSIADTTPAIIFLVWNLIVSSSDAFLKPLFLGRGMETPMLVILLGAIGGMILAGIIGLFIGAVVLALGYELMMDWLAQDNLADNSVTTKEE